MALSLSDRNGIVFQGGTSVETHALTHIEGQSELRSVESENTYPDEQSLDFLKGRIAHHLVAFQPSQELPLAEPGVRCKVKACKIRALLMEIVTDNVV
ncbi:hypothetical protein IFM46972_06196 [Aspergillus udagawae]|uniref:Uncharacterized protein n=1 Tax=Aspergillus udagawae TaxID=91492 RepID=A0A8H3NXU2_9EURO|nr:hypothetical protein IFM46972_06196 [Aspergillus udagawae]